MNICFSNFSAQKTAKKTGRQYRGSVLILVVGILTMLFMLGATFMAVAHMNAKQSAALAEKNPADPAALGLLNNLLIQVGTDRYVGGTPPVPYGNLLVAGGAAAWKGYIDCPQPEINPLGAKTSDWLSSSGTTPTAAQTIPHISDVLLQWGPAATIDVFAGNPGMVDTDGDGTNDSQIFDTGITNNSGDHYWAAVCVRDASSMINLNTAGNLMPVANMPTYTSPVSIDLFGLLGSTTYNALNYTSTLGNSRCPVLVDMYHFNRECAAIVMSPRTVMTAYRPFAIGDEMLLRWSGAHATNLVGRLCDSKAVVDTANLMVSQTIRQLLTTYNSSSQFSRTGIAPAVVNNDDIDLLPYQLLTNVAPRNRLYGKVKNYLESTGLANPPASDRMAMCFVANTLAYVGTDATPKSYSLAGITAYGTIPGCVISEVVAASKSNSMGSTGDDSISFYAIEIWNPTNASIPYEIYQAGIPTAVASGNLAVNARIVYYNCAKGANASGSTINDYSGLIPSLGTNVTLIPNNQPVAWLDLSVATNAYSIVRSGWPARAALDAISGADVLPLGYVPGSGIPGYGQRDDNINRARYNAAVYYNSAANVPPQTLGLPNNLLLASLTPANYPAQYAYPIATFQSGLRDIGNLGQIYFAASTYDSAANVTLPFSKNVVDIYPTTPASVLFTTGLNSQTAPGRLDVRANVNPITNPIYPDVPRAAMLNEFLTLLPGDSLRTDNPNRVYGRINVNTATREALMQLPFFTTSAVTPFIDATGATINIPPFNKAAAVEYILAYRDQRQADPLIAGAGAPNYASRATNDTRLTGLRNAANLSNFNGFLTPGEVAIPLSDYAHALMGIPYPYPTPEPANITKAAGYVGARDAMYRSISNLITVNSDVFVVNMMLKVQPANATVTAAAADTTRPRWYYVAVIDRGNCMAVADTPAVLLFAEVK
jgi:hypothetical protein